MHLDLTLSLSGGGEAIRQAAACRTLGIGHQRKTTARAPHIGQYCPLGRLTILGFEIMLGFHRYNIVMHGEDVAARSRISQTIDLGQTVGREIVVPRGIADVLLRHHAVPLASGHLMVIVGTEQRVATEGLLHPISP